MFVKSLVLLGTLFITLAFSEEQHGSHHGIKDKHLKKQAIQHGKKYVNKLFIQVPVLCEVYCTTRWPLYNPGGPIITPFNTQSSDGPSTTSNSLESVSPSDSTLSGSSSAAPAASTQDRHLAPHTRKIPVTKEIHDRLVKEYHIHKTKSFKYRDFPNNCYVKCCRRPIEPLNAAAADESQSTFTAASEDSSATFGPTSEASISAAEDSNAEASATKSSERKN